jgi:Double zinc ribbon
MPGKQETRSCPECKEEIHAEATRCPHCRSEVPPEPTHGGTCPACRENINPRARVCKHCGEWVGQGMSGEARLGEALSWTMPLDTGLVTMPFEKGASPATPCGCGGEKGGEGVHEHAALARVRPGALGGVESVSPVRPDLVAAPLSGGGCGACDTLVLNGPIRRPTVRLHRTCWRWVKVPVFAGWYTWQREEYLEPCGPARVVKG